MIDFNKLAKKRISNVFHSSTKLNYPNRVKQETEWPKSWINIYSKDYIRFKKISLPTSVSPLDGEFTKLLMNRRSRRNFSSSPITLSELSALLFYSAGIIPEKGEEWNKTRRFYPSGGARFPLEVYMATSRVKGLKNGLYHYNIRSHALDDLNLGADSFKYVAGFTNQNWVDKAGLIVMITAVFERNQIKYNDRGYRYILFEAGHMGQNIYLVAEALKLKVCAIGGFDDDKINKLLDVDDEKEATLYLFAVGK